MVNLIPGDQVGFSIYSSIALAGSNKSVVGYPLSGKDDLVQGCLAARNGEESYPLGIWRLVVAKAL